MDVDVSAGNDIVGSLPGEMTMISGRSDVYHVNRLPCEPEEVEEQVGI